MVLSARTRYTISNIINLMMNCILYPIHRLQVSSTSPLHSPHLSLSRTKQEQTITAAFSSPPSRTFPLPHWSTEPLFSYSVKSTVLTGCSVPSPPVIHGLTCRSLRPKLLYSASPASGGNNWPNQNTFPRVATQRKGTSSILVSCGECIQSHTEDE